MVKFIESELVLLKKQIGEMWTLVYNQLDRAGEAVLTLDRELAQQVLVRERRVNAFELKIDSDVEGPRTLGRFCRGHRAFCHQHQGSGAGQRIGEEPALGGNGFASAFYVRVGKEGFGRRKPGIGYGSLCQRQPPGRNQR